MLIGVHVRIPELSFSPPCGSWSRYGVENNYTNREWTRRQNIVRKVQFNQWENQVHLDFPHRRILRLYHCAFHTHPHAWLQLNKKTLSPLYTLNSDRCTKHQPLSCSACWPCQMNSCSHDTTYKEHVRAWIINESHLPLWWQHVQ